MGKNYSVVAFSAQALFEAFSNQYCDSEEVSRQKRAIYLSGYLTEIGAKTIVIEMDYTDGDYLEDFASYYVRCFTPYERHCKRLHFFSIEFDEGAFESLLTRTAVDSTNEIARAYLGFVVVRPLPAAIVGRTALKTYPPDSNRRQYTVVKDYKANLYGIELTVCSLVFEEQDTVLAACATVALWSAFHKTSELFGSPAPRPAEITRIANGVVAPSRPIPSHGLDLRQMVHAIRSVGLEPELIQARANVPLVSLAYSYLKMGIPVILVVEIEGGGLHALTLAGYSIRPNRVNQQEVAGGEKAIPLVGLRIDEFYAHDDQVGPFSRLMVKPSSRNSPVLFEGEWKDKQTGKILTLQPKCLLVPVYNKIRVTFLDVAQWLERISPVLSLILATPDEVEWDLHLVTNNNLKASIKKESFPKKDLEEILSNQNPRFIWRATLRLNSQPLLDLLADATDMERSFPIRKQIWHNIAFRDAFKAILRNPKLKDPLTEILQKRFYSFLAQ